MATKKQSPQQIEVSLQPPKVARLNKKMVIGILFAIGAIIAISLVTGLSKKKPAGQAAEGDKALALSDTLPDTLNSLPNSYGQLHKEEQVPPEFYEMEKDLEKGKDERSESDRKKEEQAARKAAMVVINTNPGRSPNPPQNPSTLSREREKERIPVDDTAKQSMQQAKRDFLKNGSDDSIYVHSALPAPVSDYQVMAGSIIPASLITGINSDLPGMIVAQVRENVFDTVTGNHLLIPQGARIIGQYDSMVAYGQDRVLLIWDKMVLPNGKTIVLEGMPGTDLGGYAGLADKVDYHYWRLASGIVLSSILNIGARTSQGSIQGDNASLGQEFAADIGASINDAGQKITDRNLKMQPTIMIRPGFSLNVFVNNHLVLEPYNS